MIAVIGCGNRNRCDDGAGPEVVRRLRLRGLGADPSAIRLLDAGTDGLAVMFSARGCASLIVVDACRVDAPAGAIFEVPGEELAIRHDPGLTLHDFRWNHALYTGRMLFREQFPTDVKVFLIAAANLDFGLDLSPAVAAAVERVANSVADLIRQRTEIARPVV